MGRNKHFAITELIAILVCVVLGGCNQMSHSYTTEKNKFVGHWTYLVPTGTGSNYTFTYCFFSNGTFRFNKAGELTHGTLDIIEGNVFLTDTAHGNKE